MVRKIVPPEEQNPALEFLIQFIIAAVKFAFGFCIGFVAHFRVFHYHRTGWSFIFRWIESPVVSGLVFGVLVVIFGDRLYEWITGRR
ncbi:MAG: hypothetical protein GC154_07625 [bacterium]|nr:hypothetical protein [bacterium]